MEIKTFESCDFISPESEQTLIVFIDNTSSYSDIIEFGYKCAKFEYDKDVELLGNMWSNGHTWENRKSIFNPIQIDVVTFEAKKKFCIEGLLTPIHMDLKGIFKDAYLMSDEWNTIFITAQIENNYCAFSWNTSA
jgi:hypothetical protein